MTRDCEGKHEVSFHRSAKPPFIQPFAQPRGKLYVLAEHGKDRDGGGGSTEREHIMVLASRHLELWAVLEDMILRNCFPIGSGSSAILANKPRTRLRR